MYIIPALYSQGSEFVSQPGGSWSWQVFCGVPHYHRQMSGLYVRLDHSSFVFVIH